MAAQVLFWWCALSCQLGVFQSMCVSNFSELILKKKKKGCFSTELAVLGISLAKVETLAIGLEHVFPFLSEVLICWGTLYGVCLLFFFFLYLW